MGSAGSTNDNQATPTVLVVEDEVLIRMATADYLRGCGYRVVEAGSGDEAVAVLKTDIGVDVRVHGREHARHFQWVWPRPVGAPRTTRREVDPDLRSYQNR